MCNHCCCWGSTLLLHLLRKNKHAISRWSKIGDRSYWMCVVCVWLQQTDGFGENSAAAYSAILFRFDFHFKYHIGLFVYVTVSASCVCNNAIWEKSKCNFRTRIKWNINTYLSVGVHCSKIVFVWFCCVCDFFCSRNISLCCRGYAKALLPQKLFYRHFFPRVADKQKYLHDA